MVEPQEFLAHYASKYYDPVKAHAYYMRTRDLKGRPIGKSEDDKSKSVAVTKVETHNTFGPAPSKAVGEERVKELEEQALAARDKIVGNLADRIRELQEQALNPRLNKISPTANKRLQAFLEKHNLYRRSKAIVKANSDANAAAEEARAEILRIGTELQEAVAKARESYNASRQQ